MPIKLYVDFFGEIPENFTKSEEFKEESSQWGYPKRKSWPNLLKIQDDNFGKSPKNSMETFLEELLVELLKMSLEESIEESLDGIPGGLRAFMKNFRKKIFCEISVEISVGYV